METSDESMPKALFDRLTARRGPRTRIETTDPAVMEEMLRKQNMGRRSLQHAHLWKALNDATKREHLKLELEYSPGFNSVLLTDTRTGQPITDF